MTECTAFEKTSWSSSFGALWCSNRYSLGSKGGNTLTFMKWKEKLAVYMTKNYTKRMTSQVGLIGPRVDISKMIGTTGKRDTKAPFLNFINAVPFVVVPSAKIQSG